MRAFHWYLQWCSPLMIDGAGWPGRYTHDSKLPLFGVELGDNHGNAAPKQLPRCR